MRTQPTELLTGRRNTARVPVQVSALVVPYSRGGRWVSGRSARVAALRGLRRHGLRLRCTPRCRGLRLQCTLRRRAQLAMPAVPHCTLAAISGFLMPYFTAFGSPGFYPYNSSTSIVVYVCLAIIVVDMVRRCAGEQLMPCWLGFNRPVAGWSGWSTLTRRWKRHSPTLRAAL